MPSQVALISGSDRYENLLQVLHLAAAELPLGHAPLIKPNLVCATEAAGATHKDALRAVIDFLRARGARQIIIADGNSEGRTWDAFENFGYVDLAQHYPEVRLFDLNQDDPAPVTVWDRRGRALTLRLARTVVAADCRISLTLPKTHDTVLVTLSLKNLAMGGLIGPPPVSGPSKVGRVVSLAKRLIPRRLKEYLKDNIQKYMTLEYLTRIFGTDFLPGDKVKIHQGYANANFMIAQLAALLPPHLAVIDGFIGMEGDGPVFGRPVPLGLAAAGRDALAVDATLARIMGLDPAEVGYLYYAWKLGLGTLAQEEMEIIGSGAPGGIAPFALHCSGEKQKQWRFPGAEAFLAKLRPEEAH